MYNNLLTDFLIADEITVFVRTRNISTRYVLVKISTIVGCIYLGKLMDLALRWRQFQNRCPLIAHVELEINLIYDFE